MSQQSIKSTNYRRARSASPSKSDHSKFRHEAESLRSFDDFISTKNGSLNRDQLKKLACSPISRRLHVSLGPLGNPIPFQLQLPPRLSRSSPSSPSNKSKAKFPTKMIFNGETYEPFFSDFLVLDEETLVLDALKDHFEMASPSPEKPPSLGNRRKVAKFAERNNTLLLHQLSIVHELSQYLALSVAASSKVLPPSPPTMTPHVPKILHLKKSHQKSLSNASMPTSGGQQLLAPIAQQATPAALKSFENTMGSLYTLVKPLNDPQCNKSRSRVLDNAYTSRINDSTGKETRSETSRLPNFTSYHHNLSMGDQTLLKIDKRTFSDESTVSSVSSFSSIGDAFVKSCNSMANSSSAAIQARALDFNTFSHGTLNGLLPTLFKRKIEMPVKPFESSSLTTYQQNQVEKRPSMDSIPRLISQLTFDQNTVEDSHISSSSPRKKLILPDDDPASEAGENEQSTSGRPHEIEKILISVGSSESSFDDNRGAGMSFNFPNDGLNKTNDEKAKKKLKGKNHSRNSFLGYMTPQGQIEIPPLTEESPLKAKNIYPSNAPLPYDALEKASAAEVENSDSESSFNSQFSLLQSKKFEKKHIPFSKSLSSIPIPAASSESPIKHARRKSMFNINMDVFDFNVCPLKTEGHEKQLESAFQSPVKSAIMEVEKDHNSVISNVTSSRKPKDFPSFNSPEDEEEVPRIIFNVPPRKVEYAVDFLSTVSKSRSLSKHEYTKSCSYRVKPLSAPGLSIPDYYGRSASETNSSYKSSSSGIESASTTPSETESVTIDLTREKYDVCLVQRQDSTLSYKSVIENTRDGRQVEVVLVEDDEDEHAQERDDLLSIYSRYMGEWNKYGSTRPNLSTRETTKSCQMLRNCSRLSSSSKDSDSSASSWGAAGSVSHFKVKSTMTSTTIEKVSPSTKKDVAPTGKAPQSPEWQEKDEEKTCNLISQVSICDDGSYFDYPQSGRYDFNSYMQKVWVPGQNKVNLIE